MAKMAKMTKNRTKMTCRRRVILEPKITKKIHVSGCHQAKTWRRRQVKNFFVRKTSDQWRVFRAKKFLFFDFLSKIFDRCCSLLRVFSAWKKIFRLFGGDACYFEILEKFRIFRAHATGLRASVFRRLDALQATSQTPSLEPARSNRSKWIKFI